MSEAWERTYVAAFIRCATSRGWTRENAAVWAGEIATDAQVFGNSDPEAAAAYDVIQCELETPDV